MVEANNVSPLQQHLEQGDVSAWESKLNLKATVGFPYSDYKYYNYDWDSEEDYNQFVYTAGKGSSISGHIYDRVSETSYNVTIILYQGQYFAQVEKSWDYDAMDNISYNNDSFPDYLSALKFAYGVVFS